MRRGVGLDGAKRQMALKEKLKEQGNEIEKTQFQEMTKQIAEFKSHLENFAIKHKKEINSNTVFRNQFLKMCKEIGVDPLSCKNAHFLMKNYNSKQGILGGCSGSG